MGWLRQYWVGWAEGQDGEEERRRKEKERPVMDGEKREGAPEKIKTKMRSEERRDGGGW